MAEKADSGVTGSPLEQESHNNAPIGIFDSGAGGLTVARPMGDLLPHDSIIHAADTANPPSGATTTSQAREYARMVADDLVARAVKMIVIACTTASAAFMRDARERYPIPVVEVILPAVRRAVSATRNNRIGLIGTQATVTSGAYQDLFAASPDVTAVAQACPQFVP